MRPHARLRPRTVGAGTADRKEIPVRRLKLLLQLVLAVLEVAALLAAL